MNAIIFLGPDRVGKSTLVKNTNRILLAGGYKTTMFHFREVQPCHHSPIDQYYKVFGPSFNSNAVDYCLIDRFVPDTLFYESHRANFPSIPTTLAHTIESLLIQHVGRTGSLSVVHVAPEWCEEIAQRHEEEIRSNYPGCTEYWVRINLERSKAEHIAYNKFVHEYYANDQSLIDYGDGYFPLAEFEFGDEPVFEFHPGIGVANQNC